MVELRVITTNGEETLLGEAGVEKFKASLRGELLCAGDEGYDEARKSRYHMIDKRPALIVRCAGVADVINSVNFGRTNNLLVSVRGGGHNVAGNAVCDGGIMIDLSQMKGIRVDPLNRTVRAEGGATWGDFDHENQAFGLATTGGVIPTTGIAGLTLGGGIGLLMGKYGLACDNLLSADIVTADGSFLTASAGENSDLFWGIRGGGGNFGVVTSFQYQLHPVGQLLGGMVIHPLEEAREVLKFYREFTSTEPDELTSYAGLGTSPEGQPIAAIIVCYAGPIEEGEKVLRPLREFGPPIADNIAPMTYKDIQGMFEPFLPPGLHNYWKSNFMKDISDEAIDVMVDNFAKVPSQNSLVTFEHVSGAAARISDEETAFNHRNTPYSLLILGIWPDPADKEANIRWVREFWNAMQPFSSGGVYVNYLGQEADEGEDRVKAAYGATKYERLVALKNKYDPTNLFHLNQNIRPTV